LYDLIQMGGRNTVLVDALSWRIPLVSDIPTIIFGADVTHPETGEDSSPSIAAVSLRSIPMLIPHLYQIIYALWPFSNLLLAGRRFSRLARSHKICRIGMCAGTSARAYSGPLQDMA
jgi:hypothetical protein